MDARVEGEKENTAKEERGEKNRANVHRWMHIP